MYAGETFSPDGNSDIYRFVNEPGDYMKVVFSADNSTATITSGGSGFATCIALSAGCHGCHDVNPSVLYRDAGGLYSKQSHCRCSSPNLTVWYDISQQLRPVSYDPS